MFSVWICHNWKWAFENTSTVRLQIHTKLHVCVCVCVCVCVRAGACVKHRFFFNNYKDGDERILCQLLEDTG